MWIFLALVVVPVIEIALFIKLGGFIGLWPTIALVIGTAILGAALLRAQGFAAMTRLQASVEEGGDPRGPLAHGVLILAAGLLMLTPGFFTDTVGFFLLVPPVRAALIGWAGPKLAARTVFAAQGRRPDGPSRPRTADPNAPIDADYVDLTHESDPPARRGDSGWTKPPQ